MLPDFSAAHVLVVGDVMLDRYWFGDVNRISPEAPVPVVSVSSREQRAGGAANVALNVVGLGSTCTLMSVIGADEAGECLRSILDQDRVIQHLYRDENIATTIKLRIVSQNQQLLRADFEESPSYEVLGQCLENFESVVGSANVVVISDYGKGGLVHVATMIGIARESGVPVIVDPKGSDFGKYTGATMITPNMREFETVVGACESEQDIERRAQRLMDQLDIERLLVTRSGAGMSLYLRDGITVQSPARALEVYDVSGAGDTVIAVMAASMAAGVDDKLSLDIANAAAGTVVAKLGTAVASWDEMERFMPEDTSR